MLATTIRTDSDPADSTNRGVLSGFCTMHSGHVLRQGARPEFVRDNLGHANSSVTQIVYGKSWQITYWQQSRSGPSGEGPPRIFESGTIRDALEVAERLPGPWIPTRVSRAVNEALGGPLVGVRPSS
jgi:hypothetical protein